MMLTITDWIEIIAITFIGLPALVYVLIVIGNFISDLVDDDWPI